MSQLDGETADMCEDGGVPGLRPGRPSDLGPLRYGSRCLESEPAESITARVLRDIGNCLRYTASELCNIGIAVVRQPRGHVHRYDGWVDASDIGESDSRAPSVLCLGAS